MNFLFQFLETEIFFDFFFQVQVGLWPTVTVGARRIAIHEKREDSSRVGKILEISISFSPRNLRIFENYPQLNLN